MLWCKTLSVVFCTAIDHHCFDKYFYFGFFFLTSSEPISLFSVFSRVHALSVGRSICWSPLASLVFLGVFCDTAQVSHFNKGRNAGNHKIGKNDGTSGGNDHFWLYTRLETKRIGLYEMALRVLQSPFCLLRWRETATKASISVINETTHTAKKHPQLMIY